MKKAIVAGFAAGAAMMIGGALGAVSGLSDSRTLDARTPAELAAGTMNPMIGGQAMLPGKDMMDNIAASPQHAKLTAALRESGVAATLGGKGKYTLFAPSDAVFTTQGAANKVQLAHRIRYLLVEGSYDSPTLLQLIGRNGGEARLRTLDGGFLTARMNGPTNIVVMDEQGHTADIAVYDIRDSNGVIHVVAGMPQPAGPPRQVALN